MIKNKVLSDRDGSTSVDGKWDKPDISDLTREGLFLDEAAFHRRVAAICSAQSSGDIRRAGSVTASSSSNGIGILSIPAMQCRAARLLGLTAALPPVDDITANCLRPRTVGIEASVRFGG